MAHKNAIVLTIEELQIKRDELDGKVLKTANLEDTLNKLKSQLGKTEQQLAESSQLLSQKRQEVIPDFVDKMAKILALVGMPNARFQLELLPSDTYLIHGKEQLSFAFSANKGSDFGSLKKVASGGELSRIMLEV